MNLKVIKKKFNFKITFDFLGDFVRFFFLINSNPW